MLTTDSQTVLVDNTTAPRTITLPVLPATNQRVEVKDYGNGGAGNALTNNITVNPSGNDIDGVAANYTINITGTSITFVWDGVGGWAIV